jgi:GntR family transcriptional regulator/MocR family aminotransferase
MIEPRSSELNESKWFSFERRPGEPLRVALERALRVAIMSGTLREGVRLPASRNLARELGVSRGVVTDAYSQLASQGFLIIRPRWPPLVAPVTRNVAQFHEPRPVAAPPRYDLVPWEPDASLFPLGRWLAQFDKAARAGGVGSLKYRDSRGELGLREALADHLGRTRGVIVDPELIIVTQGTSQAADLVLRMLRARGAMRVAAENPGYANQHARVRAAGLTLVGQPVDQRGIVVDGLAADAVLVTPAHQFPTGAVLSGDRRRHLISWACTRGALVVEDDYDAEFRYDHEPARALQALDPEHVIQLGTVSKTLAPALRMGWLVAPPSLIEQATEQKALLDEGSPTLDQLALALFLRSGDYDRHIRKARAVYRARRERMLEALGEHLPELDVAGVAAGLSLLVRLPSWVDDVALCERAGAARIRTIPLSSCFIGPDRERGLVIGYGRVHAEAIAPAIGALASIVQTALSV